MQCPNCESEYIFRRSTSFSQLGSVNARNEYLTNGVGRRILEEQFIVCIHRASADGNQPAPKKKKAFVVNPHSIIAFMTIQARQCDTAELDVAINEQNGKGQDKNAPKRARLANPDCLIVSLTVPGEKDPIRQLIEIKRLLQAFTEPIELFVIPSNLMSLRPVLTRLQRMTQVPLATEFIFCKPHHYTDMFRVRLDDMADQTKVCCFCSAIRKLV